MADQPSDLAKRLAAYEALMDAIVPESAYWFLGQREDADRVAFLAEGVSDPSTVTPPEGGPTDCGR